MQGRQWRDGLDKNSKVLDNSSGPLGCCEGQMVTDGEGLAGKAAQQDDKWDFGLRHF